MKHAGILLISFFSFSFFCEGQKPSRIELVHADVSEFDSEINPNNDRLIGHVEFRHEHAVMTCDSAYMNQKENNLEAFGNVRINQGDTTTLTGRHLLYFGDTRLAQMFDD